ncbi:MAG: phosphoglycerate kinase [Candidatus Uhrbacteria bacterium]
MRLKTLDNTIQLQGKRVLIRIDANVPIKRGKAIDGEYGRIARAAVDLEWLRQRGAKVIVMTHLGRPDGKRIPAYSTLPVMRRLDQLIGNHISHCRHVVGPQVTKKVEHMKDGDMVVLENLRFDPREKDNARSFAAALALLGDIYINDAFAVSHRAHASVDAIADELPAYAGPSLLHEVEVLGAVLEKPKSPFVLAMGGLKMDDKIAVMKEFVEKANVIVVGGALATAFLVAQNKQVGKSVYDKEGVVLAKRQLQQATDKFILPIDVRVARSLSGSWSEIKLVEEIKANEYIVDLGPKSMRQVRKEIKRAKTIVWNGPFGYCENKRFCEGTESLAKAIARQTGSAQTIVGGGDTLPVVENLHLAKRYTLLSSGGGAMLDFLAGKKLPGLEALRT